MSSVAQDTGKQEQQRTELLKIIKKVRSNPLRYKVEDAFEGTEDHLNIIRINDFDELEIGATYQVPISSVSEKYGLQLKKPEYNKYGIKRIPGSNNNEDNNQDENDEVEEVTGTIEQSNDGSVPSLNESSKISVIEFTVLKQLASFEDNQYRYKIDTEQGNYTVFEVYSEDNPLIVKNGDYQAYYQDTDNRIIHGLSPDDGFDIINLNDNLALSDDEIEGNHDGRKQSIVDANNSVPYHDKVDTQSFDSMVDNLPDIKKVQMYIDYMRQSKIAILDENDLTSIGGKEHINRSGWEKFLNPLSLNYKILDDLTVEEYTKQRFREYETKRENGKKVKELVTDEERKGIRFTVFVEVFHKKTGLRFMGTAMCEQYEDGTNLVRSHDVYTKAETRAFNRAMSKALGIGEVSAEEIR